MPIIPTCAYKAQVLPCHTPYALILSCDHDRPLAALQLRWVLGSSDGGLAFTKAALLDAIRTGLKEIASCLT
jgi:hypothetical protein